jgi:hypothetical protein
VSARKAEAKRKTWDATYETEESKTCKAMLDGEMRRGCFYYVCSPNIYMEAATRALWPTDG